MNLEELQKRFEENISGKGAPVGVKCFKDEEKARKKLMFPKGDMALCQIIKQAAVYGKGRGISFENAGGCVIGSRVLGFEEVSDKVKETWVEGFGYDEERFDELMEKTEKFPLDKYEAVVFAPLTEFEKKDMEPDAVLMVTNSSQAYLLLMGVFDKTGQKTSPKINGHAACEAIVPVVEDGDPWLTVPCGGARSIAGSQDDELWVAMTVSDLSKSLDRIEESGMSYPPAVNQMMMSEPNPDHPLTGLIGRKKE